ncbi:MAG: hypothetical protein QME51_05980 [Planctomycetota bacterium]|nr:hypothetical protein [Planctomycetota bacterium]MDI6787901.1 hypothetical protein [Planctomycetota bacterium]
MLFVLFVFFVVKDWLRSFLDFLSVYAKLFDKSKRKVYGKGKSNKMWRPRE